MATPANKEPMVKMNLYIPKPFKDWLETESAKTGLSQSALVHLALKTYMDQQRSMDMLPRITKILTVLKEQNAVLDPEVLVETIIKIAEE